MKKIVNVLCLLMVCLSVFAQQPGKLPITDPNKAKPSKGNLPITPVGKNPSSKSATPVKAAAHNPQKDTGGNVVYGESAGCFADDLYVAEVNSAFPAYLLRTNLSYYGGARRCVALVLKSGDLLLLSHLPDLFDKSNYRTEDCLALVESVEATTLDKKTVPLPKANTYYEYIPGFACLPASLDTKVPNVGKFVLRQPANKVETEGFMFWFGRNFSEEFCYPDFQKITFTAAQDYYDVEQPNKDAVAGFFLKDRSEEGQYDTMDMVVYGVARKMDGKWVLAKVKEEPGLSVNAKTIDRQTNAPSRPVVANPSKPTRTEQESLSKTSSSKVQVPDVSSQQQTVRIPDVRSTGQSGTEERGYAVDSTNERGLDMDTPSERESQVSSPRDMDQGGGEDSGERR